MRNLIMCTIISLTACQADKGVITYNREPEVAFLQPMNNSQVEEMQTVDFWGQVSDDSDYSELNIEWASSIDGLFPQTGSPDADGYVNYSTANLSEGLHVITLRATDSKAAQGEASITLEVVDIPEAPSIIVMHPAMNEKGLEDSTYVFMANVSDRQDNPSELMVELSSDIGGFICFMTIDGGGNAQCAASLSLGTYLLTFKVTDTDGNVAQALANFSVVTLGDFDGDLDGFSPNGGDCNDSNALVYPGAFEICDGLDNDCNELTAIDVGTTCYDDDSDGFCEIPPCVNTSETLPDCDDTNPNVSPVATEIVNSLDDNCDGLADENTNVYDDDGDGYCESPPCINASSMEIDCDDSNYNVYPTAQELCGDGLDNNCNGLTNEKDAIGCSNFYYDNDGDTYGVVGATECWCDEGNFPFTGLDNADCYDFNSDVYPGQTDYFEADRGDGSYDYNCNGSQEQELYGISGGCSWGFINNFICEENGSGWLNSVPSCGQSGLWVNDCDGSYDVVCAGICIAFSNDPIGCFFSSCSNSCNPDYDSMAQPCR